MDSKRHLLLLAILLLVTSPVFAENNVVNTTPQNSVSRNSSILTSEIGSAKSWHLSESEWSTYQTLKQGQAGYYYPNAEPPALLGLYANNENERRHYAEIYAKLEYEKVERELRFNVAFNEAANRLYGHVPVIKPFNMFPYTPIPKGDDKQKSELKDNDHLVLFVDVMQPGDTRLLTSLINRVKTNAALFLDIYFVNAKYDSVIQQWATANEIPINLVANNRITLNIDNGKFSQLHLTKLPTTMVVRNGTSKLVEMEGLS